MKITIVDFDVVELSNLNRQVLFPKKVILENPKLNRLLNIYVH
ncbi:MAG: ThiF family adenylyltransferase [Bacteroidetes bacterium]|nr:ThiF family adenylyltransferase [Bacteroidota bacterium]